MKATDIKDLTQLKAELEKRTTYEFIIGKNVLGEEVLFLQGLPKKTEIAVKLSRYTDTERQFISVSGNDSRDGYGGFGCPCDTVSEAIKHLTQHADNYGHKVADKQLSLGV